MDNLPDRIGWWDDRSPSPRRPTGGCHKLRRLCKSSGSLDDYDCPAIYLADDPEVMVCQGTVLDAGTAAELRHVGPDERGLAVPTETVLRAAALVLAEHGRPTMLDEVGAYLAERQQAVNR